MSCNGEQLGSRWLEYRVRVSFPSIPALRLNFLANFTRSLTLLLPEMVKGINEKMLYVFGVVNILTIPIGKLNHCAIPCRRTIPNTITPVYSLYPESNQRTLEEMDWLFSANKPWAWEAEKNFRRLKEQNPQMVRTGSFAAESRPRDAEKGAIHVDQVNAEGK